MILTFNNFVRSSQSFVNQMTILILKPTKARDIKGLIEHFSDKECENWSSHHHVWTDLDTFLRVSCCQTFKKYFKVFCASNSCSCSDKFDGKRVNHFAS